MQLRAFMFVVCTPWLLTLSLAYCDECIVVPLPSAIYRLLRVDLHRDPAGIRHNTPK
jgi:hypothetical protein